MSGIVGIFNLDTAPVDPEVLQRMATTAPYRGPDGIHYWIDGNIGFAHQALQSTPESLYEKQPLLSGDGLVCLVADARVDNRPELNSILTAKGYIQEKEPTDADLILAAYKCWGETCLEYLIGDFAFAIWDSYKKQLICARDVLGVKSLHYALVNRTLCVASEAQQILQHPAPPWHLNEVAMADHLIDNCFDEESTIFLGIYRLRPAHYLIATQAGVLTKRYWDVDPTARIVYRSDEDYAEHFFDLFRRAVTDRLRTQADSVGIAMSGGLDSCSVAAIAQRVLAEPGSLTQLLAFSYAFDYLSECDERAFSEAMVAKTGIEIEYIKAERFWYLDNPETFQPSLETPFQTWESLDQYLLGRAEERGMRVMLTGHGGDSLLRGTELGYADQLLRGQVGVLWEMVHRAQEQNTSYHRLLYNDIVVHLLPNIIIQTLRRLTGRNAAPLWTVFEYPTSLIPPWITTSFRQRTYSAERLASIPVAPRRFRSVARQSNYNRAVRLGNVGRAVYWYDRIGARFGLEVRHPYLDRRIVEFLLAIPPEQILRTDTTKYILRRAMEGILPEVIRLRNSKTNFTTFKDFSLREKEAKRIAKLFHAPVLGKLGIVDEEKLKHFYADYLSGKAESPGGGLWWRTITLELWLRQYYRKFTGGSAGGVCSITPPHVSKIGKGPKFDS